MDPITIAAAIAPAMGIIYRVSLRLRTFVADAKEVRDAIDGMTRELASVDSSLNVLKKCLPLLSVPRTEDELGSNNDNPVYEAIADIIDSCESTLRRFEQAVDGLGNPNRSRMARIGVQVRLDWSRDHINTCRSQLQTHIGLLNLAGQMVNLQATISASSNVVEDLRPGIDEIIARLEEISSTVNDHSNSGPQERLRESADLLVTHARSIVVQTEAATSMSGEEGEVPPNTITDFLGWRPLVSRPMTVPPTLILGTEQRSIAAAIVEQPESEDDDSDTVCDVNQDIIENWLVLGRQQFEDQNYGRAKTLLTTGIDKAKTLPDNMRNEVDIKSSELTLAACFFHLSELDEARSRLEAMIQNRPAAKPSTHILRVQHLLAQVLFAQGHLEEAEACGNLVLSGRKRLSKDSPEPYHETAALVSAILSARGKTDEAEVIQMLIPSSARLSMLSSSGSSPPLPGTINNHSTRSFGASPQTLSGVSIDIRPQATAASETSNGLPSIDTLLTKAESTIESTGPLQSPSIASTGSRVFSEPSRHETMTTIGGSKAPTSPSTRRSSFLSNPFRRASSNGRPADLCKGTTTIKKWGLDEGMETVTKELPNYVFERYRACKRCKFRSASWYPGRTERPRDPILNNGRGLRYKFSFLAAAHVSCETREAIPTYKCMICTAEQSANDVARTEDELIEHISIDHAYRTSLGIQRSTKCFFGPMAEETLWNVHKSGEL